MKKPSAASLFLLFFGGFALGLLSFAGLNTRTNPISPSTPSKAEKTLDVGIPSHWTEKKLPTIGMSFFSPEEGLHQELITKMNESDTGTVLYFRCPPNLKDCAHLSTQAIMIGGQSADYLADGRGVGKEEVQGFHEENGQYFVHRFGSTSVPLELPTNRISRLTNSHGVEMLIIKNNDSSEGLASYGMGFGYDVLINTQHPTYPGLYMGIQLYSEETAHKILESVRFE